MLSRSLHNSEFSKSPLGNKWLLATVAVNTCAMVPQGVDVAKVVGCCAVYLAVVELHKAYLRCRAKKGAARSTGLWYSEV
eukprot:m51a1_g11644 hypothetical protein (80) ;mRNA; f:4038-4324